MQNLISVWTNLTVGRQIVVILATVAMFAAVLFLARAAGQKEMALLFGNLDPAASGGVITALDQRGVTYDVRGNAIYVEATQRDSLRMALAGEGLPLAGAQGYELLDNLSGFGTTSQMFDAAYWRAREGELARTILVNPAIRSARVHISPPSSRPFERNQAPTASVTVSTQGAGLSTAQVKALQYLVGSAVMGLAVADVAVIDEAGGLLSETSDGPRNAAADERSETLRVRAERLLAARVGAGNAVVEVTVDTISETESITQRTLDPDSRIAISTDVTENADSSQDSRSGNVTVASNVPDGDAAGGSGEARNESSETRALTNFDVSETQRQVVREAGDIRRLTVAVLINEARQVAPDGTVSFEPRSEEELEALRGLVASAVGFNADRGDEITLHSFRFEPLPAEGTEVSAGSLGSQLDMMQLIQIGVLALVALALGLFVVRPILANGATGGAGALPPPMDEEDDAPDFGQFEMATDSMMFDALDTPQLEPPSNSAVDRLRELIAERESETVQILQEWMSEPDRKESA